MKTGLVLSGGGFRGAAHIGAIKALEEFGIYPSCISGTSSGAIVGALYAGGHPWKDILHFFKTTPIFKWGNYARNKPGFIDTDKFYDKLKTFFPEDSFESLQKKLFVTATNLLDGKLKTFHQGQLIKPILASAALPGVFAPVTIEKGYYVDGGILDNFPVKVLQSRCDRIIGVFVNPFEKVGIEHLKHSYSVLERAFKIWMAQESVTKFKKCDIIIEPKGLSHYGTFSQKNIDTIFEIGYRTTKITLRNTIKEPNIGPVASEMDCKE